MTGKNYKPLTLANKMPFGKYKDKLILHIVIENPHYLVTLMEKIESFKLYEADQKYLNAQYNIKQRKGIMKAAYGGMNKGNWGLSEYDVQ